MYIAPKGETFKLKNLGGQIKTNFSTYKHHHLTISWWLILH